MAWGGQEIRIFTELKGLKNFGWNVQLWAPKDSEVYARSLAAGMDVNPIPFRGLHDLQSLYAVWQRACSTRPDVLVTHSSIDSWIAGLATRVMADRPKLVRTRHLSTPIGNFLSYRWFPDAICATSAAIRDTLVKNGISESKVVAISTGVDLSRFPPEPAQKNEMRNKFGLPTDRPLVGGVFVIRSWKGIYDFVKIVLAVPHAHFVVAGAGPSKESMEQAADRLGVSRRMTFLGHVELVEEVFRALDVFLFPSTANEGIPQALLQAQACGIPAVVSDLPSIKEAASSATACAPGDVKGFADAIHKILSSPAEARRMAEQGLEWVKQFDQSKILRDIDRLYRGLIE